MVRASIASAGDFDQLRTRNKDIYCRRYPLPELCRDGRLDQCDMVAVSSGSSGPPTVWPRSVLDERAVASRFEQVFRDGFRAGERRTLAVICFALGSWVGGMYTAAACRHLAAKGYPITVVTPGNDVAEILRVVRELAPLFDQGAPAGSPCVSGSVSRGCRRSCSTTRWRATSRRPGRRCCSAAMARPPSCATTSLMRGAWSASMKCWTSARGTGTPRWLRWAGRTARH